MAITREEQKRRAELLAKGIKVCSKCGRELPVEQFSKNKRRKDGLNPKCKECESIYHKQHDKQYYQKNKEKIQQKQQQYYQENKEKIQQYRQENKDEKLQYQQQYYQKNKEKIQQYQRQHKEQKQQYDKQYRQKNKEKIQQYQQQYYQEHKEQKQQHSKQYYQENKDERLQYQQQYYQENKDERIQYMQQYYEHNKILFINNRHKRLEWEKQGNGFTPAQWKECLQFFNYECAYSGKPLDGQDVEVEHIVARANGGVHEIWNICPAIREVNNDKRAKNMEQWYRQQDYFSEHRLQRIYDWIEYAYNKWGKQEDDELAL